MGHTHAKVPRVMHEGKWIIPDQWDEKVYGDLRWQSFGINNCITSKPDEWEYVYMDVDGNIELIELTVPYSFSHKDPRCDDSYCYCKCGEGSLKESMSEIA